MGLHLPPVGSSGPRGQLCSRPHPAWNLCPADPVLPRIQSHMLAPSPWLKAALSSPGFASSRVSKHRPRLKPQSLGALKVFLAFNTTRLQSELRPRVLPKHCSFRHHSEREQRTGFKCLSEINSVHTYLQFAAATLLSCHTFEWQRTSEPSPLKLRLE